MRIYQFVLLAGFCAGTATLANAKDKSPPAQPRAYQDLLACKPIAEPAARLTCYDAQVGKLEQAASSGDVLVTDRATVREAKKGLFGFSLPTLGIFGGGKDDQDEVKSIEGKIAAARTFGYGTWRITLEDGSTWEQSDDQRLVFDPARGNAVKISRGALGTFRMNIDGQRGIKVRRVE